MSPSERPHSGLNSDALSWSRLHLRYGWWALLAFLSLGLVLESFHGLKLGFYLDVHNEVRRLMWTLAHAHGALLALVNLVFSFTLQLWPSDGNRYFRASRCLLAASFLLPAGFFLGGLFIYEGDPGLGVLLVPVGALLLFIAVFSVAREISKPSVIPVTGLKGKGKRR